MSNTRGEPVESGLFTDFYELTMAQGYLRYGTNPDVVFDMFFRRQPYGGGFSVFAGLDDLLDQLSSFTYSPEDIENSSLALKYVWMAFS